MPVRQPADGGRGEILVLLCRGIISPKTMKMPCILRRKVQGIGFYGVRQEAGVGG